MGMNEWLINCGLNIDASYHHMIKIEPEMLERIIYDNMQHPRDENKI